MNILAVITARGGSKGIPGKNITPLGGKPLIAWTLSAAANSKCLSRVVVSTDDEEIARVSREWGGETPFIRPAELSGDTSPHVPVVVHALKWMEEHEDQRFDWIVLLQPPSPFRTAEDIDNAVSLAIEKNCKAVVSVSEAPCHPYFLRQLDRDGSLKPVVSIPEGYLPRQKLPKAFAINGALYVVKRDVLLQEKSLMSDHPWPYIMSAKNSLDINTRWDLRVAELIAQGMLDDVDPTVER